MNSISAVQWWCSGVVLNRVFSPPRAPQVAQDVGPAPNTGGDHAAAEQTAVMPISPDAGEALDRAG